MSYYPSQTFNSFRTTSYTTYSSQGQFSSQYPGQITPGAYGVYPTGQSNPPSSPLEPPSAPDFPAVSPEIASNAIQKLLSSELRNAGFDSASLLAVQRFENEVVAFIEKLFSFAHDYANHANRAGPVVTDLILASKQHGLEPKEMYHIGSSRKRGQVSAVSTILLPPPSRSSSPELLPSDDEGSASVIPATLRTLPQHLHLPALPPKHTFLSTPISPPKKAALPSLEKKLKNASIVQESLKNLLLATEDNTNSEDGELFDAVVNWEPTTHPRKRWRVAL